MRRSMCQRLRPSAACGVVSCAGTCSRDAAPKALVAPRATAAHVALGIAAAARASAWLCCPPHGRVASATVAMTAAAPRGHVQPRRRASGRTRRPRGRCRRGCVWLARTAVPFCKVFLRVCSGSPRRCAQKRLRRGRPLRRSCIGSASRPPNWGTRRRLRRRAGRGRTSKRRATESMTGARRRMMRRRRRRRTMRRTSAPQAARRGRAAPQMLL
mmetsp:Transcript_7449/g.27324  ORF Transcript_7449/g.27324 Transcript_7449/m.27324 type:complete len:214 (-) Transcript_7449:442-1083(-)